MQLFAAEKKKTDPAANVPELWTALSADDKASWNEKAAEDAKRLQADMEEFQKSDVGKAYFKDLSLAQRRRRTVMAKSKYLDGLPKKPPAAISAWMSKNAKKVQKDNADKKGFEIKEILTNMWKAL